LESLKSCRKRRSKLSLDVLERGEKEGGLEMRRGSFTASESMVTGGGICELRRAIPAARRRLLQREKGGAREESRGFYRVEL
jgi:hypothetical protein